MQILAISASTALCSILLQTPSKRYTWQTTQSNQHSEQLLPAIHDLLQQANLKRVDCIAIDIGPGAFTSVRVGCAVAQGLALGWDCGIIPISSLTALVYQWDSQNKLNTSNILGSVNNSNNNNNSSNHYSNHTNIKITSLLDARMSEFYVAQYQYLNNSNNSNIYNIIETEKPILVNYKDIMSFIQENQPNIILGNVLNISNTIQNDINNINNIRNITNNSPIVIETYPNALGVLLAAQTQLLLKTPMIFPEDLQPLYIRNQVALTTTERAALAAL